MPPEDSIDEALNNFRNSGDMLQSMLNVRLNMNKYSLHGKSINDRTSTVIQTKSEILVKKNILLFP